MKRWPFALFLKLLSPGNQLYGLLEDLPVNNLDGFSQLWSKQTLGVDHGHQCFEPWTYGYESICHDHIRDM
jgi:hypothetical protein